MAIFALQLLSSVFAYFGRWWGAVAAEQAWADARERVHDALHRVPIDELVTPRVGDLVARVVSDTAALKTFVQSVIPTALTLGATVTATAVVLAVVDPRLLLVVAVPVPIVAAILLTLRRRIGRSSRRLLDRQADLNAAVNESVVGRETIRAYGASGLFDDRVRQAGDAMQAASLDLQRDQAALYPISNLVLSIALLAVLAGGGYYAIEGSISVGGLVVTYFYLARALGPIRSANSVLFGWQRTTAALDRIDQLVDSAEGQREHANPSGDDFGASEVRFSWAETPALVDFSLDAASGDRIVVIGPSGAGKSTTAKLILGLIAPDEGRLTFGGQNPSAFENADRAGIAYLAQDPFLFSGTLAENIDFGRGLDAEALRRAMQVARVDAFAADRGGLEMTLDEAGRNLSGGQRKRVALARAIAANPRLLVIDQLATDLESELVDQILSDLRLGTSATILYFGHAVPDALQPTAVYRIVDGVLAPLRDEKRDVLASI